MNIGSNYFMPARSQSPNFAANLVATKPGKDQLQDNLNLWIEYDYKHLKPFDFEDFFKKLVKIFEKRTNKVEGTVEIDAGKAVPVLSFIPEGKGPDEKIQSAFWDGLDGNILLPQKDEIDPVTGQYEPQVDKLISKLWLMVTSPKEKENLYDALFGVKEEVY